MDLAKSKQIYQEADHLFRAGHFEAALELLNQLNLAFPGKREVLYPAALCLERLGRNRDGIVLCNQLITKYQDPEALALRERLEQALARAAAADTVYSENTSLASLGIIGASEILDFEPTRSSVRHIQIDEGTDWKKYALIGVGIAMLLTVALLPPLFYDAPSAVPSGSGHTISYEGFIRGVSVGVYILIYLFAGIGYGAGGYVALALMSKLPSDEFLPNCLALGATVVMITLLGCIPIVGPIISLIVISKMYDLGCGGLIMFCIISALGSAIAGIATTMMTVALIAPNSCGPIEFRSLSV